MIIRHTLHLLFLFISFYTYATNVQINNVTLFDESRSGSREVSVVLDISWDNAWMTARNHDAVWLFFKFENQNGYRHITLKENGHSILTNYTNKKVSFQLPGDRVGVFVRLQEQYRGTVSLRLKLALDPSSFGNASLSSASLISRGIEMIFIPEGSHYLGEPDSLSVKRFFSFYSSSVKNKYDLYHVKSETEIPVGKENGSLFYHVETPIYQGDQQGPIPAAYPKGFKSFYLMKYEITQGQYASFLNSISPSQSYHRANFGGKDYYKTKGTIEFKDGKYVTAYPARPCNFISWDDAMAYADWAGLRPYTDLEFSKAARGPLLPQPNAFPWGNASRIGVERCVNGDGDIIFLHGSNESSLNDNNLETYAASYYWVMDLSGSLWERVITIGHKDGRQFTGAHGDGILTEYGFANVVNWPRSIFNEGGFGFSGGGFYTSGRPYHEFNPYSPVSYRTYGSWAGWNRAEAYGSRFARTLD